MAPRRRRLLLASGLALLLFGGALAYPAGAVAPGEIDNFSASLEGWTQGPSAPIGSLVHTLGGGPAGAGDRYVEITADGTSAGGKIVMFNSGAAWTGDWTAAGIVQVKAKLRNLGATALQVRLKFEDGISQGAQYAVSAAVPVAANSAWVDAEWNVRASALSVPTQAKSAAQILASVSRVRVIHDTNATEPLPDIVGKLGVDDLQILGASVPSLQGLGLGVLTLAMLAVGVRGVRKPDRTRPLA